MKRLILILIVVAIIGGVVAGIWWYVRQTSGPRLLDRAELALRAGLYRKARDLAKAYIEYDPSDWRGYHVCGQALTQLDEEATARSEYFAKAATLTDDVAVPIAVAESYSHGALRLLATPGATRDPDLLDNVVGLLGRANDGLKAIKPPDTDGDLSVKEKRARNLRTIASVHGSKRIRLAEEEKIAVAARKPEKDIDKIKEAYADADAHAAKATEEAVKVFLEVVQGDASRRASARALVALCIQTRDGVRLAAAREALTAKKPSPAPVALTRLDLYEMQREPDPRKRRDRLEKLSLALKARCDEYPDEQELKLALAQVALALEKLETAKDFSDQVLEQDPKQYGALIIRARILMKHEKYADADDVLFALTTYYPGAYAAHFEYARALRTMMSRAMERAEEIRAKGIDVAEAERLEAKVKRWQERVSKAMRTVAKLTKKAMDRDPKVAANPPQAHAEALAYLAETLKAEFPKEAFVDAKALYEAHPADPRAVALYVETAKLTDRPELAKATLAKAEKDYPSSPRMLLVVAGGYALLGDESKKMAALTAAIKCPTTYYPASYMAHFEYARASLAMSRLKGTDKAEAKLRWERATKAMRTVAKLISEAMERDPEIAANPPQAHAEALAYLAETLMTEFPKEAFVDAKALYEAHPSDPRAVVLYVKAAKLTDRPEMAKATLAKAEKDYPSNPRMLLAVAGGYAFLGDESKKMEFLEAAVKCPATSLEDRAAVAEARRRLGPKAEKLLVDEIAAQPKRHDLLYQLGLIYSATGREVQALDKLRKAVRLSGQTDAYRVALAGSLLKLGDVEQCLAVLTPVNSADPAANLLRWRAKLARGEDVPAPRIQGMSAAGLAATCLANGQPEKCADVCREGLKKTPSDPDLLSLLGRACLMLGKTAECRKHWTACVKAAPMQPRPYYDLAGLLGRDMDPAGVEKSLRQIPGAKPYLVDMAMGAHHASKRDFDAAAKSYARVADAPASVDKYYRHRGRLGYASALAAKGETDAALAELDKLPKTPSAQMEAKDAAVRILIAAGRGQAVAKAVAAMQKLAVDAEDTGTLGRLAELCMRIGRVDDALAACRAWAALRPADANQCLLQGSILSRTNRRAEAVPLLRRAIQLQANNIGAHLQLARTLSAEGQLRQALEALERLAGLGSAEKINALFERGNILAGWGLHARAQTCFEGLLSQQGESVLPALQVALGRALAALGQKEKARTALRSVSAHSPQYVSAQNVLVSLADTDAEKLAILDDLEKAKPDYAAAVAQKMDLLVRAGRHEDARRAFRAYMARRSSYRPVPSGPATLMVRSLLAASDPAAARDLAVSMAGTARARAWRHVAILLSMDGKPDQAARLLPPADKADFVAAMLGLVLSVQKADMAAALEWHQRIRQIDKLLSRSRGNHPLSPSIKLLASLAVGQTRLAKAELPSLKKMDRALGAAAEEIVASAKAGGQLSAEAAKLLKASVATHVGLPELARSLATESLKARPACQWAAAIMLATAPDAATRRELLKVLQPPDCRLAQQIRGALLMAEGKFTEAAEFYRGVADAEKDDPDFEMARGTALEKAGQLPLAFALYVKVWQATQSPIAANNAAYLATQLHAGDAPQLRQAKAWITKAIKAQPNPALYDTQGWIEHLLGKNTEAWADLRRAVRGLPNSPEVQYHLGVVEAEGPDKELARWHLAAAVRSVEAIEAGGKKPSLAEAKAAVLAKAALAKMGAMPK